MTKDNCITYKVDKDPYDCEIMFTGRLTRKIKPGLTVLVGCNGSGKTTVLHYIDEKYKYNEEYKIFKWNNITEKSSTKDRMLESQNYELLSSLAFSSEGEEINTNIGILAGRFGGFIRKNPDKNIIILIDGLDSGLSIDYILEVKEFFKNVVIPDVEKNGKKCYIITPANEYELAAGERCIDARSGKEISFNNYEEYKKYILESRKIKNNREQTE